MSETDSIVGIYGAVDQAVRRDDLARSRVAELLAHYRDPSFHWYEDFRGWLARERDEKPSVPEIEPALRHLEANAPKTPRERARRMFAIALAARALPELSDPDGATAALAASALHAGAEGHTEHADAGGQSPGRRLYDLLAADAGAAPLAAAAAPREPWWDSLVAQAARDGLIPSERGMYPRPCSGRLVTVPGVSGPVAALRTDVVTSEVGLEAATNFIDPRNWRECMPSFWCTMVPTRFEATRGIGRYHEVVSSDCSAEATALFHAETNLLFNFMWLGTATDHHGAVANYELERRPHADDLIQVDEGTILIAESEHEGSPALKVTTTKRIKFNYPFSSEAIALIMCALGYGDVAGALLCCAAGLGVRPPGDGPPIIDTPAPPAPAAESAHAEGGKQSRGTAKGTAGLMQDAVEIWARALRESASAIERGARERRF